MSNSWRAESGPAKSNNLKCTDLSSYSYVSFICKSILFTYYSLRMQKWNERNKKKSLLLFYHFRPELRFMYIFVDQGYVVMFNLVDSFIYNNRNKQT